MLPVAAPKEIRGKMKYKNGRPVAICELTEEEQKMFDEYCKYIDKLYKMSRGIIDD